MPRVGNLLILTKLRNSVNFYGRNMLKPDNCRLLSIDPWISTDSNHRVCSKPNPSGWQTLKSFTHIPVIVGSFFCYLRNDQKPSKTKSWEMKNHPKYPHFTPHLARGNFTKSVRDQSKPTSHKSCGKTFSPRKSPLYWHETTETTSWSPTNSENTVQSPQACFCK